ncbi:MAG: CDP-glycerol glycerophosphotransferase family protein [Coriobacteriia bacterium]|nr:CDP-glycerol glycerophosphotransferase family protein [Coriobacteriia bacterium]
MEALTLTLAIMALILSIINFAIVPKKKLRRFVSEVKKRLRYLYRGAMYLRFRQTIGRNNQMVVFESYRGLGFNCNPRGLYEHMLSSPKYQDFCFVWSVQEPEDFAFLEDCSRTKVVKRNSAEYLRAYAQAKYWVANLSVAGYLTPAADQVNLNAWHGKPIKRIGCDALHFGAGNSTQKSKIRAFERSSRRFTSLLVPAPVFAPIMASAYGLQKDSSKLLLAGYPRNDALFTYTDDDIARFKQEHSIPEGKKVALYAPTWRPTKFKRGVGYVYSSPMDFRFLQEQLGEEYVLLFRGHSNEAKSIAQENYSEFVRDVTEVMDVNELYLISDVLISDYSGTIFDFANLKRPIVYYLYDWEEYSQEQMGTYFDPHTFPGIVAKEQEELPRAIKEAVNNFVYDKQYEEFNQKFNPWEGEHAAKELARQLFSEAEG